MAVPILFLSIGTSVAMRLAMERVLHRTGVSSSTSTGTMAALKNIATSASQRDHSAFFDYIARGLESLGRAGHSPTEEVRRSHLQGALDQFQMAAGQTIVGPNQLIAGLKVSRWMALAKIGQSAVFAARSEERNFADVMDEAKRLDPRIYDLFIDADDRTTMLTSLLNTASHPTGSPTANPAAPPHGPPTAPTNSNYSLGPLLSLGALLVFIVCLVIYVPRLIGALTSGGSDPTPNPSPTSTAPIYSIHGQASARALGSQMVTIHAVAQSGKAGIYYENQGPKAIHVLATFHCAPPATCQVENYPGNEIDFTVGSNNEGHIVVDNADPATLSFDSTISIQDYTPRAHNRQGNDAALDRRSVP